MSIRISKKGEIWVSAVLYVLIITLTIVLILKVGTPAIEKMKARTAVERAQETLLILDKNIQEVANEGEGSQRIVPIELKDGKMKVGDNMVYWELETKENVIDSRSSRQIGPLKISSNANVRTYDLADNYVIQTELDGKEFNLSVRKIGDESNWTYINTTNLIGYISFDDVALSDGFIFEINNDPASMEGNGYTKLYPPNNNTDLGRASIIAHINSTSYEYDIYLTVESYSDFVIVETRNLLIK